MKYLPFQKIFSELLLVVFIISTYVAPTYALWSPISGLNMSSSSPVEYISCPNDHAVTDMELAVIIGITIEELVDMKSARSLTNEKICKLPKSRIARSLKKTKDSSKPSIDGFMEWRNKALTSGINKTVNAVNVSMVNTERQSLVVNDGPLVNPNFAPMPQGIGAIDKTRWFSLGPNNVSGRIITMFIDPDFPDTIWIGSAGGGLWKSTDNGNNWNPVADFPGNTAISVIKMDPHDHNVMYIGTGDRDISGILGNGMFRSSDRGDTWIDISSINNNQEVSWGTISDIYIDPTTPGRFIVAQYGGSGALISEDNLKTWGQLVSGENTFATSIQENPYQPGYIIMPNVQVGKKGIIENYISTDYGKSFTGSNTPSIMPFFQRTEIAFGSPNIITISGEDISATNKKIRLQNNQQTNAHIENISIKINNNNPVVSGELCIRPVGSMDSCSSYSGQIIENTGGIFKFPGFDLDNSSISGNGGNMEFELFFDSTSLIAPGDLSFDIDEVGYNMNGQSKIDRYINGQSFGSGIIYASVDENRGNIYRSGDLGLSWELVNSGSYLLGNQGWYGNTIWVNPMDSRHLIVGGIALYESTDGGFTWKYLNASESYIQGVPLKPGYTDQPHVDYHSIITDPRFLSTGQVRVLFGTDGGVSSAENIDTVRLNGFKFLGNGLNITQFYSIAGTGNIINAGAQDNGCNVFGGSNSLNWLSYGCGDGTDSIVDPLGRYVYGGSQYGWLTRGDVGESNEGMGKMFPLTITQDGQSSIFQDDGAPFIPSFILDPNNPSRMLFGARNLWMSDNVDATNPDDVIFRKIGDPDLSNGFAITSIALSKGNSDRIWVSKSDTLYHSMSGVSVSGEIQDWSKITASNLPKFQQITHIEIDYYNPNKIYVTYGGYEGSNVWMTENNGVSWVDISANLPKAPIYTIKQFRNNPNYLYVGTEVGLFSSENGGQSWTTTNEGPANTPVFDIEWYNDNTLLIATFGRGAWALDLNDLTIVPPPTISISGEVLTSFSGSQSIYHYKDPLDIKILGNGTLFYTVDNSIPVATSSGVMSGEKFTLSGGEISLQGVILASGSLNNISLRSRDFSGNWSDVLLSVFKYKDSSYINNLLVDTAEPYRATISFQTPINLSGSILYGTSSGNLLAGSGVELKMNGNTNHSMTLTGLTANTKYYYQVQIGGTGSLSEVSPIGSFLTLNTSIPLDTPIIPHQSSGSLYSTGRVYIVGATSTGVSNITTLTGNLVLSDTGSNITLNLPLNNLNISSSGAWDGTINAPIKIATATGIHLENGVLAIDSIYSIGNEMASLSLSGQVAIINMTVLNSNGSTIKIYRSPNTMAKYKEIATCIVTNNLCTFTTNHFSLFAFGIASSPSSGSSIGSGGGSAVTPNMNYPQQIQYKQILTPLQLQYAKRMRTMTPINVFTNTGIVNMPSLILDINSQMTDSLEIIAYTKIIQPIKVYIENTHYNKNVKVVLYDQIISKLTKRINKGKGITNQEKIVFILALQEIIKERRLFMNKNVFKR